MINDKRAAQILLVPYIIWKLACDGEDQRARRLTGFSIGIGQELVKDKTKLFKIAKRVFRIIDRIIQDVSVDGDKFSGYKVVRVAYYLTQKIFDKKTERMPPEHEVKVLKRTLAMMNYVLYLEFLDRKNRFPSDEEFEKFDKSASKAAVKIFDKYFEII